MAQDKCYRLGQYEIIEDQNGTLWWRSHAGMADKKQGRCLMEGKILILGPTEIQQSGCLRREFMEYLKKLPSWDKTEYYCSSHSLYYSRTGAKIRFGAGMAQYELHETCASNATQDMRRGETIKLRQDYRKDIASSINVLLKRAPVLLSRWSARSET